MPRGSYPWIFIFGELYFYRNYCHTLDNFLKIGGNEVLNWQRVRQCNVLDQTRTAFNITHSDLFTDHTNVQQL